MSEVNLISISKPSAYTGCSTAEELVAWCARVSNPANQTNHTTGPKLVRSLLRDKHWSPLEMVHVSMEIKTTRDIARQILRHRSFSFQEYSQRYADPTRNLGFVRREARLQDKKNRQNSIELGPDENRLNEEWNVVQQQVVNAAEFAYKWATERGIAKEQARAVLPEGCTESVMIMSGSLRSWVHYCSLRMDKATQKEHRIIAEQCWDIIGHHFPDVKKALDDLAAQIEQQGVIKRLLTATRVLRQGLHGLMDSEDASEIATLLATGQSVDWNAYPEATKRAVLWSDDDD